jgi:short subunit dehydrogenase-like uncharacterized protein
MADDQKIVMVLGATGYTGRLIVAELQRKGLAFGIAGRSAERLKALRQEFKLGEEVPSVVANPLQPETLTKLFEYNIGVLINCAGPFTKLGEPVVRETLEHDAHYLDITGEQAYIARVINNAHLLALAKERVAIPACGAEYALSNWTAVMAARELEPLTSLTTATATIGLEISQGTQRSVFAALGSYGIGWRDGRRVLKPAASEIRRFKFPPPFGERLAIWSPSGDTVTLPRHLQVQQVDSFLAVAPGLAYSARLVSPFLPVISSALGIVLNRVIGMRPRGPEESQRKANQWAISAEARSPKGQRTVILSGPDVYGLTAVITVWCAEQLLAPGFNKSGVLDPAQAFDAAAAIEYLKNFGVKITSDEPAQTEVQG